MIDDINIVASNDANRQVDINIDSVTTSPPLVKEDFKNLPNIQKRRLGLSQRILFGTKSKSSQKHRNSKLKTTADKPLSIESVHSCSNCGLINLSFFRILFLGIFISGGDVFSDFLQVMISLIYYNGT